MSEQAPSGGGPVEDATPVCPWCSAALPSTAVEQCPSCGAALKEQAAEIPGVTRIDPEAILRSRAPAQKSRGLIGWLSGEYEVRADDATPAGSIEPPDAAVRREMLRLELAALEAEVQARQVEAITDAVDAGELQLGADRGLADLAIAEAPDGPAAEAEPGAESDVESDAESDVAAEAEGGEAATDSEPAKGSEPA